jgi:diguanylate cyclase (GGDEF)-like protein
MRKPVPPSEPRAVPLPRINLWPAFVLALVLLVLSLAASAAGAAENAADDTNNTTTLEGELAALVTRAEDYAAQGNYAEAITLLNEVWLLAGDPRESALARTVLNSLANLHYSTGQLELADRYFHELVALDTANQDSAALSVSLFNLAHVAASDARYVEASGYFQRALELSTQLGDRSGAAYTLKALGVNAQAQVDLDGARTWLEAALAGFMELGDSAQSAMVRRNLGDLALDQGEPAQAAEYYYAALPVLADLGLNSPLLRTYRGLSLALERLGQWEKALVAQRAYTELLQATLEQQGSDTTQRLQFELDTRRYADDNARLQNLTAYQQQELAQVHMVQNLQYLVLFLGGVVLMLVLFMYKRSRNMAEKLHSQAVTDELTQLPNRRAIMEHGTREWHRTLRSTESFSCMVLDVDHFKAINDNFGHAAGDTVLCELAFVLHTILRQSDVVGRVGGEEFLLMAAGADARHALGLAERIRARVELLQIEAIGRHPLTISIGIATRTRETKLEELIQHADKALYQAKQAGRNRSIIYQPEKVRPTLTVLEGGIVRS